MFMQENELISVDFHGIKTSWNHLIFQPQKWAEISWLSYQENGLISVDFQAKKTSWKKLVSDQENELNLVEFLGNETS